MSFTAGPATDIQIVLTRGKLCGKNASQPVMDGSLLVAIKPVGDVSSDAVMYCALEDLEAPLPRGEAPDCIRPYGVVASHPSGFGSKPGVAMSVTVFGGRETLPYWDNILVRPGDSVGFMLFTTDHRRTTFFAAADRLPAIAVFSVGADGIPPTFLEMREALRIPYACKSISWLVGKMDVCKRHNTHSGVMNRRYAWLDRTYMHNHRADTFASKIFVYAESVKQHVQDAVWMSPYDPVECRDRNREFLRLAYRSIYKDGECHVNQFENIVRRLRLANPHTFTAARSIVPIGDIESELPRFAPKAVVPRVPKAAPGPAAPGPAAPAAIATTAATATAAHGFGHAAAVGGIPRRPGSRAPMGPPTACVRICVRPTGTRTRGPDPHDGSYEQRCGQRWRQQRRWQQRRRQQRKRGVVSPARPEPERCFDDPSDPTDARRHRVRDSATL